MGIGLAALLPPSTHTGLKRDPTHPGTDSERTLRRIDLHMHARLSSTVGLDFHTYQTLSPTAPLSTGRGKREIMGDTWMQSILVKHQTSLLATISRLKLDLNLPVVLAAQHRIRDRIYN